MAGRTTSRGYGTAHQQLRAFWQPLVTTGTVTCWRCQQPITPTEPWDLGHDDTDRTLYRGPEHANRCNRAAAGHNRTRTPRRRPPEPHPGLREGTHPSPPGTP